MKKSFINDENQLLEIMTTTEKQFDNLYPFILFKDSTHQLIIIKSFGR